MLKVYFVLGTLALAELVILYLLLCWGVRIVYVDVYLCTSVISLDLQAKAFPEQQQKIIWFLIDYLKMDRHNHTNACSHRINLHFVNTILLHTFGTENIEFIAFLQAAKL